MTGMIDAPALKAILRDDEELTLLDVREEGQFGEGHLLHAIPLPYSMLEARVMTLAPRKSARTVLVDDGDGISEKAAKRLVAGGYTDISILRGGTPAWREAGFEIFQGVNVPSKAFGEVVEHAAGTPSIEPDELAAMQSRGEDFVILDGRTPEEFNRMSIPGGISVPNAELVYRIHEIAPDPATTIVVNCAGRTRSIIGAQALRNAGVANRVVALKGGTMGWRLAGHTLDHGKTERYPELSDEGRDAALAYAADVERRFGIPRISIDQLAQWRSDGTRTLYLLDVRSIEEFEAGHLPGSRHAPGGQLVQATDQWCATWGARIVLLDDADNVRAMTTAHWLIQMGWDVHVLDGGVEPHATAVGSETTASLVPGDDIINTTTTAELAQAMESGGVAIIDADLSGEYREEHLPGAIWGSRPRAEALISEIAPEQPIVVYSEHETRARLMALDLAELTETPVSVLKGGREAWRSENRPLEASPETPKDAERIDFLFWVHDRHLGNDQAALDYLAWEEALPAQIEADGDARYRIIT